MKKYSELNEVEFADIVIEYALGYEDGLEKEQWLEVTPEDIKAFWNVVDPDSLYDEFMADMTKEEKDEFAKAIAHQVNKDGNAEEGERYIY